jgi:hypothetical protein
MWFQKRQNTYSDSAFFENRSAARQPVEGTVARGMLHEDDLLYRGMAGGMPSAEFPMRITKEVLVRGMDRYNIFCSPCHGKSGDGLGMIVQRGLRQPESLHVARLVAAKPGYYYGVMTRGVKEMARYGAPAIADKKDYIHPPVASKMEVQDRWAIVAFIRALQRSQSPKPGDISPEEIQRLKNPPTTEETGGQH